MIIWATHQVAYELQLDVAERSVVCQSKVCMSTHTNSARRTNNGVGAHDCGCYLERCGGEGSLTTGLYVGAIEFSITRLADSVIMWNSPNLVQCATFRHVST